MAETLAGPLASWIAYYFLLKGIALARHGLPLSRDPESSTALSASPKV